MGTEVPPEWPVLEDAKWYCVTADVYKYLPPPIDNCETFWKRIICCRTGAFLKACNYGGCIEVCKPCSYAGVGSSRVICVRGPFDNEALCIADCDITPP